MFAAMAKAIDPRPAILATSTALEIDRYDAWFIVASVAFLEVVLASFLLFGLYRRFTMAAAVVALAAFSVFLTRLIVQGASLHCGCLTPVALMPAEAELWVGLGRNIALGSAGVWALVHICRKHHSRAMPDERTV